MSSELKTTKTYFFKKNLKKSALTTLTVHNLEVLYFKVLFTVDG